MKECAWWEMGSDYMYTEERGDGWGSDAVKHYMSVHHKVRRKGGMIYLTIREEAAFPLCPTQEGEERRIGVKKKSVRTEEKKAGSNA